MKVISIGDPHFQINNMPEVDEFINKLEIYVKTNTPDLIVILGDVLHTHERLHTVTLNKANEFINRMRKIALTYVLVGNHDMISSSQFLTDHHWMNSLKEWDNVVICDTVKHLKLGNYNLVFSPYVPNGRFIEALETNTFDWKKADCIFAHQEFAGCKMGMMISQDGDKWEEKSPYIISGHIHQKQRPQENIYYTGTPIQHAFGESKDNTICVLTLKNDNVKIYIEEVDLGLTRKKIVYMDVAKVDQFKSSEHKEQVKLTLTGCYDEFKTFKKTDKYKEITAAGVKLVFKQQKVEVEKYTNFNYTDFGGILNALILYEEDNHLYKTYQDVVHSKQSSDVIFVHKKKTDK